MSAGRRWARGERPPAILLGGETIALSVARSLTAAGIPVYALGHSDDPARWSRGRRAFVDVGSGEGVQERYLEWLGRGPREGVVLPCYDEGLELVARRRAEIEALGYVPVEANDEVLLAMLDKERTYALAEEVGIPAPRTATAGSRHEAHRAAEEIGYPCALKPRRSHLFARRFGLGQKAFVVHGPAELEAAFARAADLAPDLLVTEIVTGPDSGFSSYYSYLDERGEPLLGLTKRKLRQFPTGFGLGCFHVTEWDPVAAELGLRFFQAVGLRGLACVEFKRDGRDGKLKLIECNHRFTAANEQLRAAGADLALLTYNRLLGMPLPPAGALREGVGLWYPLRDLRAFRAYHARGELTARDWGRSLARPIRFPVARLDDPLPSLAAGARRVGRRLQNRVRGHAL